MLSASATLLLLGSPLGGGATDLVQDQQALERKFFPARTRSDHELVALWYEQEATAAREMAARHQRMLDDTYRPAYGSPYAGAYRDPGFLRHCESLVRHYRQLAADALALAKLHRQLAAEAKE